MANNTISQIQIGETTYDICDATARNAIGSDTVSGLAKRIKTFEDAININNDNISLNSSFIGPVKLKNSAMDHKVDVESAQYSSDIGERSSFQFTDKNNDTLAYIRSSQLPGGKTGLDLRVWNSDTSGNNLVHGAFQIFIDRSGTVTYSVANQANFRNAISVREVSRTQAGITRKSYIASGGMFSLFSNGVCAIMVGSSLTLTSAMANGTAWTIGEIPNTYKDKRPPTIVNAPVSANSASLASGIYALAFPEGNINLYNFSGASIPTNQTLFFNVTWPL